MLGTLHISTGPGAIRRLINLGAPAFHVADTLRAVLAQRLVRTVCRARGRVRPFTDEARRRIPNLRALRAIPGACSAH